MTEEEISKKIETILAPIHEQKEHRHHTTRWIVSKKESPPAPYIGEGTRPTFRTFITVLVTAPTPRQLIAAADIVHSTIGHEFPGASVVIVTSIDTGLL